MNIGAAWIKRDKEGKTYLSVNIDTTDLPANKKINAALFKNNKKSTEKHPDYNLVWNDQKQKAPDGLLEGAEDVTNNFSDDHIPF